MADKVADFYVAFTMKTDGSIKGLLNDLLNMKLTTASTLAVIYEATRVLSSMSFGAMDAASSYAKLHAEWGIGIDQLQRWQNVAVRSNVSAEAVSTSFANLAENLAKMRGGEASTSFLNAMGFLGLNGINPATPVGVILSELRTKMPQLLKQFGSAFVTTQLAGLGVDPQMIQMFKLSQNQFNSRTGNIVGSQTLQDWLKTSESVKTLGRDFTILSIKLGTKLVPVIDDIVRVMNELMVPFLKILSFFAGATGTAGRAISWDINSWKEAMNIAHIPQAIAVENGIKSRIKEDAIESIKNLINSIDKNTVSNKSPKKVTGDIYHHGALPASRLTAETPISQHDLQILSNSFNGS